MRNFRNYDIWKDSLNFVQEVYKLVKEFPSEEKFGLRSQITRSAVSIPSNIAEGASRKSEKDFTRFLGVALGSAFELETQLIIAINLNYISKTKEKALLEDLHSIQKRIYAFQKIIENKI